MRDAQGEWKPKKIKNPAYKGKWVHPEIDNPEYVADSNLYKYTDINAIGFDLWQVKAGTIFDNVLVAVGEGNTPVDEAKKQAEETWAKTKVAEKTMKDEIDEKEKKAQEEADKKKKEEGVLMLIFDTLLVFASLYFELFYGFSTAIVVVHVQ